MDYGKVVQGLRSTFKSGKTRNVEWRITQLKNYQRFLNDNEELFIEALAKDLKKPRLESICTEVDILKNDILGTLRNIHEWIKPESREKSLATVLDKMLVHSEPYGVVLIMGAWNYPLQLSLGPLSGAIAAGNCVVLKPSDISVHTSKCIEELLPKYLDPDCFKIINGGVSETTDLLRQRFDYIFYTGSTNVGKIVHQAANAYLTPVTLELGGKSPVYIDGNCNLETAISRILWGKMLNIGQTCIAPDYILCSKDVEKKFIEISKKLIYQWYNGQAQESKDIGRIINERHFDRLVSLIQNTRGRIVLGGEYDKADLFMDLTIVTDVSSDDPLMKEEIFGPIFPIITVDNVLDAIDFINEREKPLTIYVFSEDSKIQKEFINKTASGGFVINECVLQCSIDSLPFGGVGLSGMGSYHGKSSFDTFSHKKSILIRDLGILGEKIGFGRYPPYKESNRKILQFLLKSRGYPSLNWFKYLLIFCLGIGVSQLISYLLDLN